MAKFLRTFSVPEDPKDKDTSGDTTIIDEDMATDISDQENRQPPDDSDETLDDLGMQSFGRESFSRSKRLSTGSNLNSSTSEAVPHNTFSDIVIREQLIPFLQNVDPKIRLNCCILIRKLLVDIEDVDLNVYNKLKKVTLYSLPLVFVLNRLEVKFLTFIPFRLCTI